MNSRYWPERDLLCVFVAAGVAVVPDDVGAGLAREDFGTVIADDLLDCVLMVDIFYETTGAKIVEIWDWLGTLRFYG